MCIRLTIPVKDRMLWMPQFCLFLHECELHV